MGARHGIFLPHLVLRSGGLLPLLFFTQNVVNISAGFVGFLFLHMVGEFFHAVAYGG